MAHGYKRLTRKAKHIIRNLKRTKHSSVQKQYLHELRHEVSRTHGFRGPKTAPDLGKPGRWRPPTRKAKQLLTRLRKTKVWSAQKQLVTELARELEKGRRLTDRAREKARRARRRARNAAKRARSGYQRTRQTGRRFRERVKNGQEKLLTRAERRQAEREKRGLRKPGPVRQVRDRLRSRAPYSGPFHSRRAHRRWGRRKARREVPGLPTWFAQRRGWKQRSPEQRAWTHRAQRLENRATRHRAAAPRMPWPVTPRIPAPRTPRTRAPRRRPVRTR